MKRIYFLIIILAFSLFFSGPFSWADNPFQPKLPVYEKEGTNQTVKNKTVNTVRNRIVDTSVLNQMKIEGVFWGTDEPYAIIDGEIYRIGDKIKNVGAEITDIKNGVIQVIYKKRVFILSSKQEIGPF